MLIKAFSISLLAAGTGLALSKMAAALRGRRLPPSTLPHASVLPVAFWDAATERLEEEEPPPPTPRINYHPHEYDSIEPEDLSVEWLTRATEASQAYETDEDDEVEIEVGSSSMVSEASRAAARSAEALEGGDSQRQPTLRWDTASEQPDSEQPKAD
jgi:antitoxin component of MazEF toxin-antitoxin module